MAINGDIFCQNEAEMPKMDFKHNFEKCSILLVPTVTNGKWHTFRFGRLL